MQNKGLDNLYTLAVFLEKHNLTDGALNVYDKMIRLNLTDKLYLEKVKLTQQKNIIRDVNLTHKIHHSYYLNVEIICILDIFREKHHMVNQALVVYDVIIKLNPNDRFLFYSKLGCQQRHQKIDQAFQVLDEMFKLNLTLETPYMIKEVTLYILNCIFWVDEAHSWMSKQFQKKQKNILYRNLILILDQLMSGHMQKVSLIVISLLLQTPSMIYEPLVVQLIMWTQQDYEQQLYYYIQVHPIGINQSWQYQFYQQEKLNFEN